MNYFDRVPGWRIPAIQNPTRMQRYGPLFAALGGSVMGLGAGALVALCLEPGDRTLLVSGLAIMTIVPLAGILIGMAMGPVLQRPLWPVLLYKNGVEVHLFAVDRLLRKRGYFPIDQIARVRVVETASPRPPTPSDAFPSMTFVMADRSEQRTGPRSREDLGRALDYIRKEWPSVQVVDERASDGAEVHAGAAAPLPAHGPAEPRAAPVPAIDVPYPRANGRPDQVHGPRPDPPVPAPYMNFCPACGGKVVERAQFCYACGYQFGSPVPWAPHPAGPAKSPEAATVLGLIPGLMGLLGFGQFYVRSYAKGLLFLFLGILFAFFGFGSVLVLADPQYAGSAAYTALALICNPVFLLLLVISVIDARKTAMTRFPGTR